MKILTRICFAALVAGILAGCKTKEEPAASITATGTDLFSQGIAVPAAETDVHLTFSSMRSWRVTADDTRAISTWIIIVPASGEAGNADVTLTILENTSLESRSATVSVISESVVKTIALRQAGRDPVAVTAITLNKSSVELYIGETATLTATVIPSNAEDKTVTWSTSDAAVATVADGVVTAVGEGKATITAKAGEVTATCEVTVPHKVVEVASITLDKPSLSLLEGDIETLTATVSPANADDPAVTWSTSNAAVATVTNGVVTAIAPGEAVITAKAGTKTATCTVTVAHRVIEVESVTLDQTTLEIITGETATLIATVNPANADDPTVTWTTSDASVATVEGGVVTARTPGTATITAKAGTKMATCTVTVKNKPGSTGENMEDPEDIDPWKK